LTSLAELKASAQAPQDSPEQAKKRLEATKAHEAEELLHARAFANEALVELDQANWLQFPLDAGPPNSNHFVYNSRYDQIPRREGTDGDDARVKEGEYEYERKEVSCGHG
jgi:hypothetical protein